MSTDVTGFCPMGCGPTLFVGSGGYVTCWSLECPRRKAVSDILGDNESEHIVEFYETTFTVRHPLRERLDDALMSCELHQWIADLAGPPVQLGRYRALPSGPSGDSWTFIQTADADGGLG
jgi:hypothetical protein